MKKSNKQFHIEWKARRYDFLIKKYERENISDDSNNSNNPSNSPNNMGRSLRTADYTLDRI